MVQVPDERKPLAGLRFVEMGPRYDPDIGTHLTPGITPKPSEKPGALTWPGRQTPGPDNDLVVGELLGLSLAELAENGIT